MVRIQGRGVAGTVAAKVKHLFGLCKEFEEKMCKVSAKKQVYMFFCRAAAIFIQKVWKWRRFLTDVGCWRYKMRHLQIMQVEEAEPFFQKLVNGNPCFNEDDTIKSIKGRVTRINLF